MKKGVIHIGTSGWHYAHWKENFYPPKTDQLDFYSRHFDTVELNNSFYKMPSPEAFAEWRKATPRGFLFSVKGSRFVTHLKKLNVEKKDVTTFMTNARRLGKKLGPVLFQLPPRWKCNTERLERFIKLLPASARFTIEFRDHSWYVPEVYEILKRRNIAFCIYDLAGYLSPLEITADFVYVRLHGPSLKKYHGSYNGQSLKKWADRCRQWQQKGMDVYIYFDNDTAGNAPADAARLKAMIG
jgi:uncharacterized protein YecE (DUF72 family)